MSKAPYTHYVNLSNNPLSWYYDAHFTDAEIGAKRGWITFQLSMGQSWN